MKLVWHTLSTPDGCDPTGMRPVEFGGDGVSSTLPARYVSGDRTELVVEVLGVNGQWSRHEGIAEGRGPGQVSLPLKASRSTEASIKRRFAAIESDDPSPVVRGFAGALIDREMGREIESALERLMDIAESKSSSVALKMQALQAVAFLLHDHDS